MLGTPPLHHCVAAFACFLSTVFAIYSQADIAPSAIPLTISSVIPLTMGDCTRETGSRAVFGAECGELTVAENPDNPQGRKIAVHVVRLPAIKDTDKAPVFFIAGGPGQASTELAENMRQQFHALLKERDLVFVDQRGTGASNPLNCEFDPYEYAQLAPEEAGKLALIAQKKCIESYDAELKFYTTPYAVKDLEQVRVALGYPIISLWGGSYGTRVELEYLRSFPNSLHSVVMDGVAPVSLNLPHHVDADGSRALQKIFNNCAQHQPCNSAFPELERHWRKLVKALAAEPITRTLRHPRTQQAYDVYIDASVVSSWVQFCLYVRDFSAIIPLAIHKASQDDFSQLFAMQSLGQDNMTSMSVGMQATVMCAEDFQFNRLALEADRTEDDVNASELLLRATDIGLFNEMCAAFPKGHLAPDYFTAAVRHVPTLLLSGGLDPVTPPHWAEEAQRYLPNSQHIVVPGGHHNVSGLGCMPNIIEQFYDAPLAIPLDSECVADINERAYFIDTAGPNLSDVSSQPSTELSTAASTAPSNLLTNAPTNGQGAKQP
ncbi:MAG: pimeloyl-ACP methyl ester carboxylesterase [Lentisphaeria bacterium]|jgi:pimeloyl-ACP methyl ester carboxylesterase